MAILSINLKLPDVISVFGFGSYFKYEFSNDVDLLVIVENNSISKTHIHLDICLSYNQLEIMIGKPIDVTVLTECEAKRKPLNESKSMILLYSKN